MVKTFKEHYWKDECQGVTAAAAANHTAAPPLVAAMADNATHAVAAALKSVGDDEDTCMKEICFMSLILMLGTLWLGVTLFNFTKTPFLNKYKREFLSDYALPVAVVVFSVIGSVLFANVKTPTFPYKTSSDGEKWFNVLFHNNSHF